MIEKETTELTDFIWNSNPEETKDRYRKTLNNMMEGCAIVDFNWHYLYVNNVYAEHARSKREELVGKSLLELNPGFEGTPFYIACQKCIDFRVPQKIEAKYTFEDDSSAWYQVNYQPVPEGVFILTLDITDYKKAENNLRISEEKYHSLFNSIDEGFSIIEVLFDENNKAFNYKFLELNPAFEKQTGLHNSEGKTILELVPDLDKDWFAIYGDIALTGKSKRFKNSAAALGRYYDVYAFRVGKPEERKVAVLFNDISEQKNYEYQIYESNKKLELQLKEKEVLIKEIFHRSKNILQIISSLLNLKTMSVNNPDIHNIVSDVQDRIRAISLVHEKLYKGPDLSNINLKEYIKSLAVLLMETHSVGYKIKLETELEDVHLMIDSVVPCGLILTELIMNTIKHAFPGDRCGFIRISLSKKNDSIELSVADNGVGFNQNEVREEDTLGLQLFRSIAEEQLRGRVNLEINNGVKWTIKFRNNLYHPRV